MAMLPVPHAIRSHALSNDASDSCNSFAYCHNKSRKFSELVFDSKAVCRRFMRRVERIHCDRRKMGALASPNVSVVKTSEKVETYRFRTEFGDRVQVVVEKYNGDRYEVRVELESLQFFEGVEEPVMVWGLFTSDSTSLMLDSHESSVDGQCETRFVGGAVELEFEADLAPFYVSFLLKSGSGSIRSHRNTNFIVPVGFGAGRPYPLGVSYSNDGSVNLALVSSDAESVVLCLYADATAEEPAFEIDLDPYINRSGDVWHALLYSPMPFVSYGYRCRSGVGNKDNRVLLDPYAKIIGSFGSNQPRKWLGRLCKEPAFDWSGEVRPNLPMEKMIVYRLNVARFTKDKSSKLADGIAGSFGAISEKLQHFKNLGVNAILLEPIFPFDEQNGPYFPLHFFSPDSSYGPSSDAANAAKSMKEMVKKLHARGIEVLMEVVFTHTGDDGALKEIDSSYGCSIQGEEESRSRNALNCNHPVVQELILESLRYWVTEFHVDGFSFINASSLTRDPRGEILPRPPLVEAIALDPLLARVKIIADSDPLEMEVNEVRFPHWQRWAEMNSKFSYDVKNFVRGRGLISELATRLCGSGDMFLAGRGPAFSFNYITRNSGLTLVDLVSFSRSELEPELSWNCGEEGATGKTLVLETRLKQIRNLLFILFVSLGVPVLNMGDECGQSTGGSIAYTDRKPLDWNSLASSFGVQITKFISFLSSLKTRRSDLLQNRSFLKEENIEWHGKMQSPPEWEDPDCKFVAMTLRVDEGSKYGDLFLAFNAANRREKVSFPPLGDDESWVLLVDTALPYPGFFSEEGLKKDDVAVAVAVAVFYEMKPHSCILYEARKLSLS